MRCRFSVCAPVIVALVVLWATVDARADVQVETCPASVVWSRPSNGSLSIALGAPSSRSLHAELAMYTDRGFYTALLPDVTLAPKAGVVSPKGELAFRSPVLSVVIPDGVVVYETWLRSATVTQGQPDWVAAGPFACFPPQGDPLHPYPRPSPRPGATPMPTPEPMRSPDASFAPIGAAVAPNLERTDCPHPFVDARAITAIAPPYPFDQPMPRATALVLITIDPNGKAIGSTVPRSSGYAAYDIAAQRAAEASTYAPAIAFCRPVYGRYFFKASFQS